MSLLQVRDLAAGYGSRLVLDGIDLEVATREIVAVVGPSGSGKSTLLRALTALVPVTRGSIRLFGREIAGWATEDIVACGVAHIPERRRLFGGLTVRENLLLGGWNRRRPSLDPALDVFPALAGQLGRPAGALSGGEQQLCALARGLMAEPVLMLVDELSLGLAPMAASEILVRLPDIAARGTAVVLIDQDAGTALSVAERAYVLDAGRVVAHGPSGRLLSDHQLRDRYLDS